MRIGISTDVFFKQEEIKDVLSIPLNAVEREKGRAFAYFINEGGEKRVEIKTGRLLGKRIELLEGLSEGDLVGIQSE